MKIEEYLKAIPIKIYDEDLDSYMYTEKQVIKIINEYINIKQ